MEIIFDYCTKGNGDQERKFSSLLALIDLMISGELARRGNSIAKPGSLSGSNGRTAGTAVGYLIRRNTAIVAATEIVSPTSFFFNFLKITTSFSLSLQLIADR